MKKIRLLSLLLVILMVFSAFVFAACSKDEDEDKCADGEHEWKNEQNPQKRKTIQERSCTLPEIKLRECKNCDVKEEYESEPAAGHRYNSTLKVYLHDATCTEDGHTLVRCMYNMICGTEADKLEVLPGSALGHEYVNYVQTADGYSAIAKCIRCSVTDEKLLGLKLDMEGDRSHLSYQSMAIYTGTAQGAAEYKTVTGEDGSSNAYLSITRSEDYTGDSGFGVILSPKVENLMGKTYVIEGTFYLDEENTGDLILFKGVKAQFNQSMVFATYNSESKTIESLDGTVYALGEDDFANGVKVSLLIDDAKQLYQVYINDKLASFRPVTYVGDYYPGVDLAKIEIVMSDKGASTFGVDDIYLYTADHPNGFDNDAIDGSNLNVTYIVKNILSGQAVSYRLPVLDDVHTEHNFVVTETFAPDCVLSGYTLVTCTGCGGQDIVDEVPELGHSWDEGVEVPPNCFEAGYKVYTCNTCGQKRGDMTAPANGHTHGTDAVVHEPTCSADGYTEGNCVDCGTFFTVVDRGSMCGHKLGDDVVVVEPSCSVDGGVSGNCIFCGSLYTDPDTVVKAYGHYDFDFSEFTVVEPTCDEGGYEVHTCLGCGETYKENEKPANGHVLYSNIEGNTQITKCRVCDYEKIDTIYTGDGLPTYDDVVDAVGSGNMILCQYVGTNDALGDSGTLTDESGIRYASWKTVNSLGNSYATVAVATKASIPAGGNDHAHRDWGNKTTAKKTVVFEFDVKYPSNLTADQTTAGLTVQPYYTSPTTTFTTVDITATGVIRGAGGTAVAKVNKDSWTRVAVVTNFANGTYTVYADGYEIGTAAYSWTGPDYMLRFRINFTRPTGNTGYIDIDNMMTYYAEKPVYFKGAQPEDEGDTGAAPEDIKNINAATHNRFRTDAGFEDYAAGLGASDSFVYKTNYKWSVVDKDADGTKDAYRVQFGEHITSVPNASGKDSHITISGFNAGSTYTLHFNMTLTEASGRFDIVQGRRTNSAAGAQYPPSFTLLKYERLATDLDPDGKPTKGKFWAFNSTVEVAEVNKGDTVDIYIVYNDKTKTSDVYLNGILVVDDYYFANLNTDFANSGGLTYKIFNNSGTATDKKDHIDVLVNELDFFNGEIIPADYKGKVYPDYTVPGGEKTILSFDETDSTGKLVGENNAKVPGGYVYSAIEGKSYLSLKVNPATAIPAGNVRYVMIDPNGREVESGGVWTLAAGDFKTNGNPADPYFVFNKFDGIPQNADGSYDFSGYKQVIIRVYADVTKVDGYKIGVHIESPASTGSNYPKTYDKDGNPTEYYPADSWLYTYGATPTLTTGWHDIVLTVNESVFDNGGKWSRISEINFNFSGWGYGQHDAPNCVNNGGTEACKNHYKHWDGLNIFVESIRVVEKDATIPNTSYTQTGVSCFEHTYGEPVLKAEPTGCTGLGYSTETCTVCGYVNFIVTAAKGHTPELVEAECVAATCATDGYNVYKCKDCDFKYREYVSKTLHDFVLKENATAEDGYIAADCVNGGQDVYVCANENCNQKGKTFVLATDPLGHVHGDDVTVTEADCYNDKTTTGVCTRCNENFVDVEEGTKLGHNLVTTETPATCTDIGHKLVKCDREGCGYVQTDEDIPALGHDCPADYLVTFIEMSCATYKGIRYNCRTCGEVVEEFEYELGKDPHVWGDFELVSEPTCGKNGFKEAYCKVCGLGISENGTEEEKQLCILLATGKHTYDYNNYVYSSDNEYEVRTKYYACTVCGEADPATVVEVPAKHSATDGLIFSDNNNGAFVITGYNGTATEVVIPATYSGKPVILGSGLEGNANITSVVIPAGVKVSAGAFKGCTALESVELPSDLTEVPSEMFYGCTALESIVLPEGCTVIRAAAFYGCTKLATVEIKGTLTAVEQFAFAGCDALATVKYVVAVCPVKVIAVNGNAELIGAAWVTED